MTASLKNLLLTREFGPHSCFSGNEAADVVPVGGAVTSGGGAATFLPVFLDLNCSPGLRFRFGMVQWFNNLDLNLRARTFSN